MSVDQQSVCNTNDCQYNLKPLENWEDDWFEADYGSVQEKWKLLDKCSADKAMQKCREIGGEVVLPSNEMENSDLIKIVLNLTKVSNYDVSYIHLRITDIAVEGNIDEKLTF